MAIYLGGQKVSPSLNTIIEKTITITKDTNGNIISTQETQDISNTSQIEDPDNLSADLPEVTEWTRPSGWPDLSALPALTEGVYLTYDNRSNISWRWASFMCRCNTGSYRIAQGHVSGSTWTQDAYWDIASGSYKEVDYHAAAYDFVVFKITPASTNHITEFYFARIPQTTLNTYALTLQHDQYCLERVGKLPYLTTTNGSGRGDNHAYCCEFMEHDNVEFGNSLTNLAVAWYRARNLKKLEFGSWTGAACNITSLDSTFRHCHAIEKLDLSQWETGNWHVSSIYYMFDLCINLKILIVPFNTTNWGAASNRSIETRYVWQNCRSLESLDLSTWDVSGWKPNSFQCTWASCYRLKSLNIKNWNTTNWAITSLYQTWDNCQSLVDIDLSNWNTSNWAITTLGYTWRANFRRRSFKDIENWDTHNWNITSMAATFDSCYYIQELDLTHWNVSNWACTDLGGTWSNCRSLRYLYVGNWDMTQTNKWKVTSIYAMFNNCWSLKNTTFFEWHPINWAITRAGSAFYACRSMEEIDTTKWKNLSGQTLTWTLVDGTSHMNYFAAYAYCTKKINFSNFNTSAIAVNNYGSNATSYTNVMECYCAQEIILPSTHAGHLNLRYCYSLNRNEIVRLFNALPTALSGAKIVITEMRYKLTNADIAIATNKGYTVS